MLGLVLKDILVCKKNLRQILILVAVFAVLGMLTRDPSFILPIITIYFSMMVLTGFAYDAQAKWDAYGMTMPVTRSETVLAKYLLGFVLAASGSVLSFLLSFAYSLYQGERLNSEYVVTHLAMLGAALLIISIFIPLIYRFGVEKARLIIFLLVIIPSVGVLVLSRINIPAPSDAALRTLATLSPFILVVWMVISYRISVGIFSKKEL